MFSENLIYLRVKHGYTQTFLANELAVTRQALIQYEKGSSEPKLSVLKRIAAFYGIAIDLLVNEDLKQNTSQQENSLNTNFRVLVTTIDESSKERIEFVPINAHAGYLQSFREPIYIKELTHFSLPQHSQGKYRAFEIKGDSMPPIHENFIVIGKYIEKWSDIKDDKRYILITKTDGIVFKRAIKDKHNKNNLILLSDNPVYSPYSLHASELIEAWSFTSFIGFPEK